MKRAFVCFALLASGLAVATNGNTSLPSITHPNWVSAYDRAAEAAKHQDYNKALAFLTGCVYEHGVTVALDTSSCPGMVDRVSRAEKRAYDAWSKALGKDCPIHLLANDQPADLVLTVVKSIPTDGDALGMIQMKKCFSWGPGTYHSTSTGTIDILTSFEGSPLDDDELTEVVCHEMGHLLGLADIDHTGFLMGPLVRSRHITAPTPDEAQAVRAIRSQFHTMIDDVRSSLRKAG